MTIAAAERADPDAVGTLLDALCALNLLTKSNGEYPVPPSLEAMLPSFSRSLPLTLNQTNWANWGRALGGHAAAPSAS